MHTWCPLSPRGRQRPHPCLLCCSRGASELVRLNVQPLHPGPPRLPPDEEGEPGPVRAGPPPSSHCGFLCFSAWLGSVCGCRVEGLEPVLARSPRLRFSWSGFGVRALRVSLNEPGSCPLLLGFPGALCVIGVVLPSMFRGIHQGDKWTLRLRASSWWLSLLHRRGVSL